MDQRSTLKIPATHRRARRPATGYTLEDLAVATGPTLMEIAAADDPGAKIPDVARIEHVLS